MRNYLKSTLGALSLLAIGASQASAALTTFIASDNNASSLATMPNSSAMRSSFLSAVTGTTLIDFESGLPAGVTPGNGVVTSNSGCGQLCGFNTTVGGQNFLLRQSGGIQTLSLNFATAIDAFGVYVTGLQDVGFQQSLTITYASLATATFNTPVVINGAGFFGFSDPGAQIISVTFNRGSDIVAFDDVNFRVSAVPEPATWAMMLVGFAGLGYAARRRKEAEAAA